MGVYDFKDGKMKTNDAGLVLLSFADDKQSLTKKRELPLKDFIPAQPAFIKDTLIVPESYGQRIALIEENTTDALSKVKEPKYHRPLLFRFAKHWHDDVVFLGEQQGLVAFSLSEGFFPFPFNELMPLDKKQKDGVVFGPSKMLFRPDANGPGFSAWVLSMLQSRIVPLDLMEIFGP